jgi:predicted permease
MPTWSYAIRYAVRTLTRRPGFTFAAVITLALGIGATTTIFTLVDAVVLSPLPFDDQARLIRIGHAAPGLGVDDAGQCAAWHFTYEDEAEAFDEIGMYGSTTVSITGAGDPEIVSALVATSGVFRALRLRPVVGRDFGPSDEDPDNPAIAFLGHAYWQTRFGGDLAVVGRTLEVEGASRAIVGVMPPTLGALGQEPDVILPFRTRRANLFVGNIGYDSVARLREGVSLDQARADLARVMPLAWEKFPGGPVADSNGPDDYTPLVTPLKDSLVGSVAGTLWILLGGVGVVLLIACANVANLCLVRADSRQGEMAVRLALGASRSRLAWEYLKESLVLGALGGAVGLGLAWGALRVLVASSLEGMPRLDNVAVNPSVLAVALVISVGAALFFGTLPVLRAGRRRVSESLQEAGRDGARGRERRLAQNALGACQVALALVLLVGSVLLVRTSWHLADVDPGFGQTTDVLTLSIYIPPAIVPDTAEMAATHERIARRLEEIPGVSGVALASSLPMGQGGNVNPFYARGGDHASGVPIRRHKWLGEGYFEFMRTPVLTGRTFPGADIHNRFPGVILSESLAREYFGSADAALGRQVAARPDPPRWHQVVGVVADTRENGLDQPPVPMIYWPQVTLAFWQGNPAEQAQSWRSMSYAIRSSRLGSPDFIDDVREAIWSVNPILPLRDVASMPDLMAASIRQVSFTLEVLGLAAGIALILGLVGVYSVIAYGVSQRRRELAMRMVLGAAPRQVTAMVLRHGGALFAVGAALGIGVSWWSARLLSGLLFGVSATDPMTYAIVATGLLVAALLASYVPARRAARIEPTEALRG